MSAPQFKSWQSIHAEVLRRIHAREWVPGQIVPNEVDLAREFSCARATVNRAMQALADSGILERRRRAGTRVALHPVSKAVVDIPVIRREIEDQGSIYGYRLLSREIGNHAVCGEHALHVVAVHLADDGPFVIEDRWINTLVCPKSASQSFESVSANEWLLSNAPYTAGDISFSAMKVTADHASLLATTADEAIFVVDRTTWDHAKAITTVRLSYAPGYRIRTVIGTAFER